MFDMNPYTQNRNRPAVAIVGGIVDPLIIQGQRQPVRHGGAVIGFQDFLGPVMGKPLVADEDAKSARREVVAGGIRQAINHASQAKAVLRTTPIPAFEREPRRERAVYLGELIGLLAAVIDARAGKEAESVRDLLLEVDRRAGPGAVLAHQGGVGRRRDRLAKANGISVGTHAPAVDVT